MKRAPTSRIGVQVNLLRLKSCAPVADEERRDRRAEHDELAPGHIVGERRVPGFDRVHVDRGDEGDGEDDDRQEDQTAGPAQTEFGHVLGVLRQSLLRLSRIHLRVEGEVADEQQDVDEQPVRPQSEGPFERHTAQHAEEQRRIAQRREQTAAVRDDEDRIDDRVGPVSAVLVRVEDRSDEQHRRTRGADEGGEHTTDGEEDRVVPRRRFDVADEEDSARSDEQTADEHDELEIFEERIDDGGRLSADEEPDRDRHAEDERDDEFDEVAIPDLLSSRDQGEHRDAPEQQNERNDAPPGHDHPRTLLLLLSTSALVLSTLTEHHSTEPRDRFHPRLARWTETSRGRSPRRLPDTRTSPRRPTVTG